VDLESSFKILSKGVIVSTNSSKYEDIANFLSIEENFEQFNMVVSQLGYNLNGENGYFYLSVKSSIQDSMIDSFINNHKNNIISIAILKQLFPFCDSGQTIKKSEFITKLTQDKNPNIDKKLTYIFGSEDTIDLTNMFFDNLNKSNIIEQITKDSDDYKILKSFNYYLNIVDVVSQ
jgi:hypothetical protein